METKIYWTVEIYYGGDSAVEECFKTEEEAKEFCKSHDICDKPAKFYADTFEKTNWAKERINDRLISK